MDGLASLPATALQRLADGLRTYRGMAHKQDIQAAVTTLADAVPAPFRHAGSTLAVGDDCAALPDGDGYLLFAIEGFLSDFVAAEPWFAGWCGLMVNLSDIAAMGGRPLAVVDALWSRDDALAVPIMQGLRAASQAYGVPVVGGHSNTHAGSEQLAVSVLGRARRLLTSFDAQAGDHLLMAIDLRGHWHDPYPFFDAATSAPPARLQSDLALLPALAEAGLCRAAKDISMAGIVGTAAMLMECSGLGGEIDLARLPCPAGTGAGAGAGADADADSDSDSDSGQFERWLRVFPSYGYLLAVNEAHLGQVLQHFQAQGIACAAIGHFDDSRCVRVRRGEHCAEVWNLAAQALTGCPAPGLGI